MNNPNLMNRCLQVFAENSSPESKAQELYELLRDLEMDQEIRFKMELRKIEEKINGTK